MKNKELEITKNMNPHLLHSTDNIPKKVSIKNKKINKIKNSLNKRNHTQKDLDKFEQYVESKRNAISKKSGQGGYVKDELSLLEIIEFLTPVRDENGEKIPIGCDENGKEHYRLLNLYETEDAVGEDLTKVGGAFDNKNDRGLVWLLELLRVSGYKNAVFNNEHEGLIVLIDIQSNIKSFKELKDMKDSLIYTSIIDDVIAYWSSFLKNGHTHFVVIGKNRFLLAIPSIYHEAIEDGKLEMYNDEFVVDVKVWKKFVTSDFKSTLYKNEKGNFIDNDIQMLIGNPSPYTDVVYELTKTPFNVDVLKNLFKSEELLAYMDRQLIADLLTILNGEYTNLKPFLKNAFESRRTVTQREKTLINRWFKLHHYWFIDKKNGINTVYPKSSQTFKMLMMQLFLEIEEDGYKLVSDSPATFSKVMATAQLVRSDMDVPTKFYALGTKDQPLNFGELMGGYKGTSATWRDDLGLIKVGQSIPVSKKVSGNQHELLNELYISEIKKRLIKEKIIIKKQKRSATTIDKQHIISLDKKDDRVLVRVDVLVIDPKTEKQIRFSEVRPDDPVYKKYGISGSDYAWIPLSEINTQDHWVEHIIPFNTDPEQYDINSMEISSATLNRWRQDKEIVNQAEVLQDILERRG